VGTSRRTSPLSPLSDGQISPTMTDPDNRQELLSPFEYGVWVFLALAGATALGVISYLAYVML
jgi:hypothetical protein